MKRMNRNMTGGLLFRPISATVGLVVVQSAFAKDDPELVAPADPPDGGAITPYAGFTTEALGNLSGGFTPGWTFPGLLDIGVEVDLEAMLGWWGASVTATAFAAYGEDGSAKSIGDFNVASNLFTDTDFNLFNLFYRQELGEWGFLKLGQIAVDDDFMAADTAGLFLNSAFGPLPTESGNLGAPIFPLAAPGGLIRFEASEALSFQGGIYSGDAGPVESGNHGFKWRTGGAAGWVVFGEAGVDYGPGVVKLGGYEATGSFTDFRTGGEVDGAGAVYLICDHRFLDSGDGGVGLSGFIRLSVALDRERVTVERYVDAGLVVDSLVVDDDALGFAVSHTEFGTAYRRAHPGVTARESVLELSYRVPLGEHWRVQPDLQYILSPHFSGDDALVGGIRCEWSLW